MPDGAQHLGFDLRPSARPFRTRYSPASTVTTLSHGGEATWLIAIDRQRENICSGTEPWLDRFLSRHPQIRVEIMVEDRLVDAIAGGCRSFSSRFTSAPLRAFIDFLREEREQGAVVS